MNPTLEAITQEEMKERARRAWRRGRVLDAAPEALLAITWVTLAAWVTESTSVAWPAAAFLILTAVLSWVPHPARRVVLPALLLAAIPLGCALVAQSFGHHCGGESCARSCASWCAPACAGGGLLSGVLFARVARAESKPFRTWLFGGGLIVAAGALGCACLGAAGVVGLVLGFLPSAGLLVGASASGR